MIQEIFSSIFASVLTSQGPKFSILILFTMSVIIPGRRWWKKRMPIKLSRKKFLKTVMTELDFKEPGIRIHSLCFDAQNKPHRAIVARGYVKSNFSNETVELQLQNFSRAVIPRDDVRGIAPGARFFLSANFDCDLEDFHENFRDFTLFLTIDGKEYRRSFSKRQVSSEIERIKKEMLPGKNDKIFTSQFSVQAVKPITEGSSLD